MHAARLVKRAKAGIIFNAIAVAVSSMIVVYEALPESLAIEIPDQARALLAGCALLASGLSAFVHALTQRNVHLAVGEEKDHGDG